jgi:hypothetical protein
MPGDPRMTLLRDEYTGPACLEYSWVPQGTRRLLRLPSGQPAGHRIDPTPPNRSHVQVYSLTNTVLPGTERGGLNTGWQFPPGPPYGSPIREATVRVYHAAMVAEGTVVYKDGHRVTDERELTREPLRCPQMDGGLTAEGT